MAKPARIVVDKKIESKMLKGYPLIIEDALSAWHGARQEGRLLDFYGENGKFVARGYYGRQNKGHGWIISRSKQDFIDTKFFKNKIQSAMALRKSFKDDKNTTAYRVFNGEGDGIGGLTIDHLNGHYLITWYSEGIYSYREMIIDALKQVVDFKSIYQKKRFDDKGKYIDDDDFVTGSAPEFPIIVLENGVKFAVYLNDGPMIGFFLDQKDVRNALKKTYVKDKRVLNTFSYTGAFSVYAALGGASHTTSVDLAKRSREKTVEQFEINGIDPEGQSIIVEDVFNYFKYAAKKNLSFDVVILDPPSFARSKKHTFSVYKDYTSLLEEAINITERGGVIVASTNYSNADMKWFKGCVKKAFSKYNTGYQILESYSLPKDFHVDVTYLKANYLKVLFIKKL